MRAFGRQVVFIDVTGARNRHTIIHTIIHTIQEPCLHFPQLLHRRRRQRRCWPALGEVADHAIEVHLAGTVGEERGACDRAPLSAGRRRSHS